MDMWIFVEMIDTARIECRCTSNYAVDLVTFSEQELGQVAAVLSSDSGDQCLFHMNITITAFLLGRLDREIGIVLIPFIDYQFFRGWPLDTECRVVPANATVRVWDVDLRDLVM